MVRPVGTLTKDSIRDKFIKVFGKPIEQYETFKRATAGMSDLTIKSCRRTWPYYFLFINQDPDTVIAQRKKDLVSDNMEDNERYEKLTLAFIKSQKGLAGKTIACRVARVQGFFTNNSKRLSLDLPRLRLSKARKKQKYSPTQEQVKALFEMADCKRDRLIIALMAQSGANPVDVSLLCIGDYPGEAWQYFERSRSKTGEIWRVISTPDVCTCMREYLPIRAGKKGERLFMGREGVLNSAAISQIVRNLIVKNGFDKIAGFKPTCLRDFFEDSLVDAEVYFKNKKALMGHNVDIEHEYGGQKKLEAKLIESMRKVYPLICLNENNLQTSIAGFDAEQTEKLKTLLDNYPVFMKMAEMLEKGKLKLVNEDEN